MKSTVTIIQEHLPAFRIPFYQKLHSLLAHHGINLRLIYAPNQRNTFLKANLDWAEPVPILWLGPFAWQPVLRKIRGSSLVIVQQEIKYAANPILQLLAKIGGPPVAYWGHGRNFQKPVNQGFSQSLKNILSRNVHWWFAYNDLSAAIVRDLGFPPQRITSVGNAIDTTALIQRNESLTQAEIEITRNTLGIRSENVAVYTGGLYPNKRIDFLIAAAQRVRATIPDFELIIIGDGPERPKVHAAASTHPWIHEVGPLNDQAKVPYWALAKLLMMPGLVGLVVVDSFALGVPLVTTDYPYHSPEIDYLKHGVNGLRIACGDSSDTYADAISDLLGNPSELAHLRQQALASAHDHTIEKMAASFADGVMEALNFRQL